MWYLHGWAAMRIVHTSDWHLGHALHDASRELEHARFLAWLLDALADEEADALVITGDVFDGANPPASALAAWYDFLASARARRPALDIVVIGGNHDSPARLDAPERVLRTLGIHVIGGLPRLPDGSIDVDRMLVPLRDAGGQVAALCCAVPFLRVADLPRGIADADGDPLIEGVRAIYARVFEAARERRRPGQALIATGHCYMVSTKVSRLSERRILGGNQHALPMDIFPDDLAYVALGHLHKPQRVGPGDRIRYAGAPIPLAMNEAVYRNQLAVVDLDGEALAGVHARPVPRAVDLIRVPARGALPLDEVPAALAALDDAREGEATAERPFLEVCVALPRPEPRLRRIVEEALAGKRPRLVKLEVEHTGDGAALSESLPGADLKDLDPEEVFLRRYRRDHESEPPAPLVAAFRELLDQARAQGVS